MGPLTVISQPCYVISAEWSNQPLGMSSGLTPPALQALCKLVTTSEAGEQLIHKVQSCNVERPSFLHVLEEELILACVRCGNNIFYFHTHLVPENL